MLVCLIHLNKGMMKIKKVKVFFKSFYISALILFCFSIAAVGVAMAYENTRQIGFGEYKRAIEITEDGIRILDFEMNF